MKNQTKMTLAKVKQYARTYATPFVATIMALGLWYYYGNGEYLWFLVLIGVIIILNVWVYITDKKES